MSAPGPPIGQLPEAAQSALSGHPEPKVASKPGFKMRESDQKFIGDFPLGIGEKGKRQWVDVYVSEDRARDLQAQVEEGLISKRSEVTVVGFPKEKTVMKEGKKHIRRWINAVAIKPKLVS